MKNKKERKSFVNLTGQTNIIRRKKLKLIVHLNTIIFFNNVKMIVSFMGVTQFQAPRQ